MTNDISTLFKRETTNLQISKRSRKYNNVLNTRGTVLPLKGICPQKKEFNLVFNLKKNQKYVILELLKIFLKKSLGDLCLKLTI